MPPKLIIQEQAALIHKLRGEVSTATGALHSHIAAVRNLETVLLGTEVDSTKPIDVTAMISRALVLKANQRRPHWFVRLLQVLFT